MTSNLPFDEWTLIFGSERLTGDRVDCWTVLTHHVHILEMRRELSSQPKPEAVVNPQNRLLDRQRHG